MQEPFPIPFQQVLDSLLNEEEGILPVSLYRLSNLEGDERDLLAERWNDLSAERRRSLIEKLEKLADTDVALCYEPVARIGLEDADPDVRLVCIRMLWEEDSPGLEHTLLDMLENDVDERVRAEAGSGLGRFVYEGELEEISAEMLKIMEDSLLRTINGQDTGFVRRKALEALGFSSRPEVPHLIENAFASDNDEWVASALFAMGRSADKRWAEDVLGMLKHENPSIRLEAVRAVGELEIKKARRLLIEYLDDADEAVREAAIWSLSQIGGEGVADALENLLEDNEDVEEVALIEEALDNLAFNEGFESFKLFDFDDDELNELTVYDDVYDDEEDD